MAEVWIVEVYRDGWQDHSRCTTEKEAQLRTDALYEEGFRHVRYRKIKKEKPRWRY